MNVRYKIAKAAYIGAGGDPNRQFDSVEEIYAATEKLYGESSNRVTIEPLSVEITSNGLYEYNDDVSGYKPVSVNVNVDIDTVYKDGYNNGVIDGQEIQKQKLSDIIISQNGTYTNEDGYNEVKVQIDAAGFDYTSLGYDEETSIWLNSIAQSDIDYSRDILDNWNSDATDLNSKFYNNKKIKYLPVINTSKASDMHDMFRGCSNLIFIPQLDTSNVTNMRYMFENCSNLTSIPQMDTSKVTDMAYLFRGCSNLTSIPQLVTGNVINMSYMFEKCSNLTSIPQMDTSKVTTMSYMFSGCSGLTSIPQMDTSKVTTFSDTFSNMPALISVPLLDASKVNTTGWMFDNSTNVENLGGFKNFGMVNTVNYTNTYFIKQLGKLTHESLLNVFNNLYDRASAGLITLTIGLHKDSLAKLTEEDIAIATNKGWIIS